MKWLKVFRMYYMIYKHINLEQVKYKTEHEETQHGERKK